MSQLSVIKDRRSAIVNLRKVTRAMELVTKTKIARMRQNAKNANNYQQAFYDLASAVIPQQPRIQTVTRPVRYVVSFFSQKGFCGNFNEKLMHLLSAKVKELQPQYFYLTGKRTSKWSYALKRDFIHIEAKEKTYQQEFQPLLQQWQQLLTTGKQPIEIYVVYNKLNSILDQQPTLECIYPFKTTKQNIETTYFEPDQQDMSGQVLLAYLKACLEKVYWESIAGEFCSRLLSMKNANDNASIIIDDLNLEYNKTRQSKITQELSEVVSAFDVLKLVQEKKQRSEE
jgi:F-type H+-transporting ATPase subunit gamma